MDFTFFNRVEREWPSAARAARLKLTIAGHLAALRQKPRVLTSQRFAEEKRLRMTKGVDRKPQL